MAKFYAIRIRFQYEYNQDSVRDFLHHDFIHKYPFKTFEEAEASLEAAVETELNGDLEEDENREGWHIEQTYDKDYGGGFWFKTKTGEEGRAMVITCEVPE